MWWLCAADGTLPVGEVLYFLGIVVLGGLALENPKEIEIPRISFDEDNDDNQENSNDVPNITYPGDDPSQTPGDDYEWKGQKPEGGSKGSWINKNTGEQFHPDLNHPKPVGPHWDYTDGKLPKRWWRVFPDGVTLPK